MGAISGLLATQDSSDIPVMGTGICVSSAVVANAAAAASLAARPGQTAYLTGFEISAAGATAANVVTATITGLAGGTMNYVYTFPAGASVAAQPVWVSFYPALAASAPNTAITLNLPAGGAGNAAAAVAVQGFYL